MNDSVPFQGDCSKCSDKRAPICGSDGFNYKNECLCTC
ncbi:MAG: hypothetical protein GY777_04035 [Candidatus Brocadiaceae bacterium]|nr:hypothetical protein [Candidatus Brocadiaceae bacterium]